MSKPRSIQIEISTFCNANCTFCPRTDMTRPKGTMSDVLFHKIIKEGKELGVRNYIPFLNGEPFANPKIFDWLDYLEKEGVTTCLFTNAGLLDKEKIDRLVKLKNIKFIHCSINAATKETYEKVTRGPDFDRVVSNVHYLIDKAPFKVIAGMTTVQENVKERRLFWKIWRGHVHLGNFANWAGSRHDPIEMTGEKIPCTSPENMYILWDGRVCQCCMDFDGQVIMGDINKQSLKEIWDNGQPIRDRHHALDFNMPLCRDCNLNARRTKMVYP